MSKRELASLAAVADLEGSRSKRRREAVDHQTATSSDVDVTMHEPADSTHVGPPENADLKEVKELGLKLWQAVRDAVNKEGRTISLDFLRKPSKRQYPDYYQLIKQPIALDDIKKQIENGAYSSMEAVKRDFELCFNNAKQYNMKDSVIWKDAKDLLKVAHKTYSKLVPGEEDGENIPKVPSLNRLIKSRLQKLVEKADDNGRILSAEFMELVSKKQWPLYYKEIKKPQCLENIFKRIKRKEYHSAADFAADVELVFSNALAFNLDHTQIWEDALTLRDYFRELMSDLPAPHILPQYSKTPALTGAKIKIKPQGTAAVIQATTSVTGASLASPQALKSEPSSLLLKVPSNVSKNPSLPNDTSSVTTLSSGAGVGTTNPAPAPSSAAKPVQNQNQTKAPVKQPSAAQQSSNAQQPILSSHSQVYNSAGSHYSAKTSMPLSNATDAPSSSSPSAPNLSLLSATNNTMQSPGPSSINRHLKSISIRVRPSGRVLDLDHREGVKSWAMRLVPGETSILVRDIVMLGDDEDVSSDEEEVVERKASATDLDIQNEGVIKNGRRKKGKARAGARIDARRTTRQSTKQKVEKSGDVQLKLNGVLVNEKGENPGEWDFQIPTGSSSVEIGEAGSMPWRIYIERRTEH